MSEPKQYELWCAIENYLLPFPITIPTTRGVGHLKESIYQKVASRDVSRLDLILIRLKVPKRFEDDDEVYISQDDLDNSSRLQYPSQLISEVWQTQPLNDHVHVYVILRSQDTLRAARKLYDTLWGKDINDILLDVPNGNGLKYVPQSRVDNLELRSLNYRENALLIRNEYVSAYDKLETRSRVQRNGVVVSGQPGIGKSCFLFYVLFRRLCNMKPTAFHTSSRFVIFKHTGVTVHDANKEEGHVLPAGTWALTDSNESVRQPCPTFLSASTQLQAWIVQTTCPAKDRWYQWSKELDAGYFVMECFTYEKLIALGTILNLDLDRFREQIELWGLTARTCVWLTRSPNMTDRFIQLATIAAINFTRNPDGFIDQSEKTSDTDSDLILTKRPKDPERASTVMDIETKFLRNLVDEAIKGLNPAGQVDFFRSISHHPWFRASAGYVFEKFVYAWLFTYPTSKGLPCTARSPGSPKRLHFIPVCERVHVFRGITTFWSVGNYKTPFCWLPTSGAFPVADAIICTNIHIITIQSTVSSHHEANAEQFKEIQEAFPKSFRDARRWCYVFVTNEENKAKALRDQVFEGLPEDVDIYSAVLDTTKSYLTPEDLARSGQARNKPDEMDTGEAEEEQATEASDSMMGVSADGPGGEQQV